MIEKINFPAIIFDNFSFRIVNHLEELTHTTSAGLKNGLFENIIIIDSTGNEFKILNAKKNRGIGPFWGYNIFLNQNIIIDIKFHNELKKSQLFDLKNKIKSSINKEKYFWESGGNLKEIVDIVNVSDSFKHLILSLGDIVNKKYTN